VFLIVRIGTGYATHSGAMGNIASQHGIATNFARRLMRMGDGDTASESIDSRAPRVNKHPIALGEHFPYAAMLVALDRRDPARAAAVRQWWVGKCGGSNV
jgi:hypothetical protein